jgi:hypothetical protein
MQSGLLPEGQQLISAEEFVELEGENEVFEKLEDDEIVSLVKSRHRQVRLGGRCKG